MAHHIKDHDPDDNVESFLLDYRQGRRAQTVLPALEERVRRSLVRRSKRRQMLAVSLTATVIVAVSGGLYWFTLQQSSTTTADDVLSLDAVPSSYFNDVRASETLILSTTDLDIIFSENQ